MRPVKFQNQDCFLLENKRIQLILAQSIGPRILGLNLFGKTNLLAELPDFKTPLPDGSDYHIFGGHRLWMAPENLRLTYDHDDHPVEIRTSQNTVTVKKKIEKRTGIEKTLRIQVDPTDAKIEIEHILKNCGNQPLACAAWAITQFKTGGVAILPQSNVDTGLLPNRSLVFWPYTDVSSPRFRLGNEFILVDAVMDVPFKVGFPNSRGWLAYWLNGCLFVKRASYDTQAKYYDWGSSSECYCNDRFLELETLSPKTTVQPGDSITHKETWEIFEDGARPETEEDASMLLKEYGLEK